MNEISINAATGISGRSIDLIAAEINSIKGQTRRMVLYNSIEIGRRLVEAKQLVPHGEWGDWLEHSVEYSKSTANNLMRIFQEYASDQLTLLTDNAKSQALGNLSYTQAIALLGLPEAERETFVKENDIDNMSTRELQQTIKEKEQALKEKEELEKRLKAAEKKSEASEKLKKELEEIKEKNKEQLTNKEVEIENLKLYISAVKEKLDQAQASGDDEEINKLQSSLQIAENEVEEAYRKIEDLERKLKEKPIEVVAAPQVIEKVPEEVERELQELREKINNNSLDETEIRFRVKLADLIENFKGILEIIVAAPVERQDKYKLQFQNLLIKYRSGFNS
jgi:chromosome segregation ATPase